MWPVTALINNFFTFLDENTSHIHKLAAGELSHAVSNLTRLIRQAGHFEHLHGLRRNTGAAQAGVVKRYRHIIILRHRPNALRDLSFRLTDSIVLILGFVSQ